MTERTEQEEARLGRRQLRSEAAKVANAMDEYGGSFMQRLANAIEAADYENLRKIRTTWYKDWQKYLAFYGEKEA